MEKNVNIHIFFNSNDFGQHFRRINAEVFDTHIRKDGGIMKSPVNPDKVCSESLCMNPQGVDTTFLPTGPT